ncbi:hypothetical protein [Natronosalvus caseinilyticus]|uniref:hypothetical protein n=1 Tax=Natronosalvus caseinilyticus TaxID=2953747 RepID=UPI0028AB0C32|nr:hypothetical protein [Natronosalvus caseinilyticus]
MIDFEFTPPSIDIDNEALAKAVVAANNAKDYFDAARALAEAQIDIEYPWNYDPANHQIQKEAVQVAITWAVEAREGLESANDDDLEKLASRMEECELAFVDEWDDTGASNYYETLYLAISTHDALISWLCEKDPNLTGSDPNNIGEDVYWGGDKEEAVKRWFGQYAPMNLEEGDSSAFKDKWEKFFKHRHWIMHGHPDAHFDANLALTALFFLGLTGYIVDDRYNDLVRAGKI